MISITKKQSKPKNAIVFEIKRLGITWKIKTNTYK
jgi:hypothetical protein